MARETVSNLPDIPVGKARGASPAGFHSIQSKLECAKKFQFEHVRGIIQPTYQTPEALAVGALLHAGRARWFSKRFDTSEETWQSVLEAIETEAQFMAPPPPKRAVEEATKLVSAYIDHWSRHIHPKPLVAEYDIGPATLLEGKLEVRTARLDDVSYYDGDLCIGEAKTTSVGVQDCVNQYTLHGQPMLQMLLWKRAPQGEAMHGPARGVMLDIIKKPEGKTGAKFARHFLPIPDHALQWYAENLTHEVAEAALIEWDTKVRRNVTSCTRQIGRARVECPYRQICLHGRDGISGYTFKNGESLTTWKPEVGQMTAPWE